MTLNHPSYRPDAVVRSWLFSFPGLFEADTPQLVMAKAFTTSGLSNNLDSAVFAVCLKRAGYVPTCLRASEGGRPGIYRLALPEGGVGVTAARG